MAGTARRVLLALLVAWTAFGCLVEVHRCRWWRVHDPLPEPSRWRFLSAHVERLDGFLDRVRGPLPDGAAVAVSSEPGPAGERFVRSQWVAYLLPENDVRHAATAASGLAADYWIAYGTRLEDPRLEPVVEAEEGALYRVLKTPRVGP